MPALPFDTASSADNGLTGRRQPKPAPYLAWDDAAAYASVAWLPPADVQASRKLQAKRFVIGSVMAVFGMMALAAGARSTQHRDCQRMPRLGAAGRIWRQ